MKHQTAHAIDDTLLFHDWMEARELWKRLVKVAPGLVALCLMPNHVHVLTTVDCRHQLRHAMSAYARWRNAHREESGPAWIPIPPPTDASTVQKQRRDQRYIHLNPCRRRLVADPLAWPFSTHRDAVGLAVDPARRRLNDPHGFHRYVSGDPTVAVQGTALPLRAEADLYGPGALDAVWVAVSAVTRTPGSRMHQEARARRLFVRAARTLTEAPVGAIADKARVTRKTVHRAEVGMDREVQIIERVCGDPRFGALGPVDHSRWILRRRWRP